MHFPGGEEYVLKSVLSAIEKLCGDVHRTTFAVILAPITVQLNLVQSAPAWCASVNKTPAALTLDLPDYSFAPQEYITQVSLTENLLPVKFYLCKNNFLLFTFLFCFSDWSVFDDPTSTSRALLIERQPSSYSCSKCSSFR